MEIFTVCADIHGDRDMLLMMISRSLALGASRLLCAGDICIQQDPRMAADLLSSAVPVLMVRGNCDSPWAFSESGLSIPPRLASLEYGVRTLVMTHGDSIRSWEESPIPLGPNDMFIHGHTHVATITHNEGAPWVLNPGSASRPRDRRNPTMAVISESGINIIEIQSGNKIRPLCRTW